MKALAEMVSVTSERSLNFSTSGLKTPPGGTGRIIEANGAVRFIKNPNADKLPQMAHN